MLRVNTENKSLHVHFFFCSKRLPTHPSTECEQHPKKSRALPADPIKAQSQEDRKTQQTQTQISKSKYGHVFFDPVF